MVMMLSKFNKDYQKSIQGYIEFLNHEGALAKAALKIEVLFCLLLYIFKKPGHMCAHFKF
jgi:hypothetical protein